jgi:hypothetical protein
VSKVCIDIFTCSATDKVPILDAALQQNGLWEYRLVLARVAMLIPVSGLNHEANYIDVVVPERHCRGLVNQRTPHLATMLVVGQSVASATLDVPTHCEHSSGQRGSCEETELGELGPWPPMLQFVFVKVPL